jgi:hypothetical protein
MALDWGEVIILEWILIAAIPAAGFLILSLVLDRWGKRHDPMGGRPGRIWKSDDTWRRLGRR